MQKSHNYSIISSDLILLVLIILLSNIIMETGGLLKFGSKFLSLLSSLELKEKYSSYWPLLIIISILITSLDVFIILAFNIYFNC